MMLSRRRHACIGSTEAPSVCRLLVTVNDIKMSIAPKYFYGESISAKNKNRPCVKLATFLSDFNQTREGGTAGGGRGTDFRPVGTVMIHADTRTDG